MQLHSQQECENQTLVNAFSRWCNWAKMKIRPHKYQTFAMKKVVTQSKRFKPKNYVDNIVIKSIEEKESFRYLGRWFNFDMDNSEHKRQLLDTTNRILSLIHQLPLYPKNKLQLYNRYCLSKISRDLMTADIDATWKSKT